VSFEHVYLPGEDPSAPTLLLLHGTGGDEHDLLPIGTAPGSHRCRAEPARHGVGGGHAPVVPPPRPRGCSTPTTSSAGPRSSASSSPRWLTTTASTEPTSWPSGSPTGRTSRRRCSCSTRGPARCGAVLLHAAAAPGQLPDLSHAAVYLGQGRVDPMAPAESAEELARLLDEAGAAVTLDWHDAGHQLGPAQLGGAAALVDEADGGHRLCSRLAALRRTTMSRIIAEAQVGARHGGRLRG
jgi:phospholipase/carboxylesterase